MNPSKKKYFIMYEYTNVIIGPEMHQVKNQYGSKGLFPNIIRISSIKLLKPIKELLERY